MSLKDAKRNITNIFTHLRSPRTQRQHDAIEGCRPRRPSNEPEFPPRLPQSTPRAQKRTGNRDVYADRRGNGDGKPGEEPWPWARDNTTYPVRALRPAHIQCALRIRAFRLAPARVRRRRARGQEMALDPLLARRGRVAARRERVLRVHSPRHSQSHPLLR